MFTYLFGLGFSFFLKYENQVKETLNKAKQHKKEQLEDKSFIAQHCP